MKRLRSCTVVVAVAAQHRNLWQTSHIAVPLLFSGEGEESQEMGLVYNHNGQKTVIIGPKKKDWSDSIMTNPF